MKKTSVFGVLASAALLFGMSVVPTTVYAEGNSGSAPTYSGNEFFANGTPITIEESDEAGKSALITWDGGKQLIDADDIVYGGSDSTAQDVNLPSTKITMNGGTVRGIVAGNKMKNEKNCKTSKVTNAEVDINGGKITLGLWGTDNQNAAFGQAVIKEENGYSYKNYAIDKLTMTIDGAEINDLRGATSYTYIGEMDVRIGEEQAAVLNNFIAGTNGKLGNVTLSLYDGEVKTLSSLYRAIIEGKLTYHLYGGKSGVIYAGSYYPDEESYEGAGGAGSWWTTNFGNVDYGYANAIEINVEAGAAYQDIVSGFQYRSADVAKFKALYADRLWAIEGLNETAPVTLNLGQRPSADPLDAHSLVDASAAYVTTNWKANTISIDPLSLSLQVGESAQIKATVTPSYATEAISYSSSDPSVATVAQDGTVTAKKAGTAIISATAGSAKATCEVSVAEAENEVVVDLPSVDQNSNEVEAGVSQEGSAAFTETLKDTIEQIESVKGNDEKVVAAIKAAMEAGDDIETTLTVEKKTAEEVSASDVKAVEAVLRDLITKTEAKEAKVAQYLDLSILVEAQGSALGKLNQLSEKVTFTVAIPQQLQKENYDFYIVRIHGNEVTRIPVVKNADGTVSFQSDRFSTYALVYTDGAKTTLDKEEVVNPSIILDDTKPSENGSTPNTGDASQTEAYAALLMLSLALAGALTLKKKLN